MRNPVFFLLSLTGCALVVANEGCSAGTLSVGKDADGVGALDGGAANACGPDAKRCCMPTGLECVPSGTTCPRTDAVCPPIDGGGAPACASPSPAGCASTGCAAGEACTVGVECVPSGCSCDATSRTWACTADCNGGKCVPIARDAGSPDGAPNDAGSCGVNPAGCVDTGCPAGESCVQTSSKCVPSSCSCSNGGWTCTADCSGGVCVSNVDGGPADAGGLNACIAAGGTCDAWLALPDAGYSCPSGLRPSNASCAGGRGPYCCAP